MSFANTDELIGVLNAELKRHPAMKEADLWTLLHENEFGPEPFPGTEEELLQELERAMTSVEYEEEAELYEYIGNGVYRLNLVGLDTGEYSLARVALDLKNVPASAGTLAGFQEKIDWVKEHFSMFRFRFSADDWQAYLMAREAGEAPAAEDRPYRLVDRTRLRDFRAEKEAERTTAERVLLRIAIALVLCLLAVGMAALGKYLYGVIVK